MDEKLRTICEDFISNRDVLRDSFKREGMAMHMMAAAVMSAAGSRLTLEDMLKCNDYLESNAGIFSSVRGVLKMPMIINMALSGDFDKYFERVKRVYEDIAYDRGSKDERLYLAAMIIASAAEDKTSTSEMIGTAGRIFDETDAAGRFFTDMSDYVTAVSAAASGPFDIEEYLEDFGRCKSVLGSSNSLGRVPEDLCLLLAAKPGDTEEKCARVMKISESLGESGIRIGSRDTAPILADLYGIDMEEEEIARHVADADVFLKDKKGFGVMGAGKATRQLYAAMLTCVAFADKNTSDDTVVKTAVNNTIDSMFVMMTSMITSVNMVNMMKM